ncbi:hypothetical protein [Methanosphaerula subterraneus]|uniref:zinc ribbon domain-containing protein n=1 Tax=Methanosphaerula subterraneus TaxID=3350244 RepID=UPI003F856479
MMYCHNCGARIAGSEDKYCTTCGAQLHASPNPSADSRVPPSVSPSPEPATTTRDGFFGGLHARARGAGEVEAPPVPAKETNDHPSTPPQPAVRSPLPIDELRTRQEGGRPATRSVQSRPLPVDEQRQRLTEEEERRNARHLEQARRSTPTPVRAEPPKPRLREAKGWVPWPETVPETEKVSSAERLNRMVPGALQQKDPEVAPDKKVEREPPVAERHGDGGAERRAPTPPPAPSSPPVRAATVPPSPTPAAQVEDPIIPWVTPLPISTPEPVKKVPLYEVPQRPPAPPRHPSRPKKGKFRGSGLFEGDGRGIKPSWILAIAGLIVLTLVIFTIFPVQDAAADQGRHMKINPLTGGIVNSTPSPTTPVGADSTDLMVTINYKGAWSGKIVSSGSIYREIPINGVGIKQIPVNQQSGIVSVQAQKKDDSRESLIVRITRGSTLLKEGSTVDPSGSLTVSASLS